MKIPTVYFIKVKIGGIYGFLNWPNITGYYTKGEAEEELKAFFKEGNIPKKDRKLYKIFKLVPA
jgi:hypothetical protein